MKSIKNNIIFFQYDGDFSPRANNLLFQEISEQKTKIQVRALSGVCVMMKNITLNINEAQDFIKHLCQLTDTINTPISICDYRSKMFPIWVDATKNTRIRLFKTERIAQLFLNPKSFKQTFKVLFFDDGHEAETEKQSSFLARYGHNIIYTNDKKDFENKLAQNMVDFAISQTKLNLEVKNKPSAPKTGSPLKLSKSVIINLPFFIDTAVDTLMTITGLDAKKTSHEISHFKESLSPNIITSIMKFSGDIEGTFVLVFPKDLANEAIEAMIGESIESEDIDALQDGIGEFCNIITGSAKTQFQSKKINTIFELPQTYVSIEEPKERFKDSNGVWIDMQLENKPFYMFITN